MRRCLAIGLAILILALGARGVAAQDDGQSVSDRLLEILKQRQIISGDEYSELKGLASKMEDDNADLSRRLGELDRSIADYLAKGEDDEYNRAHVAYRKGSGFQFATADGMFELNLGGFFLFSYTGWDMGRKNGSGYRYAGVKSSDSDNGVDSPRLDQNDFRFGDDTNNFAVEETRFHFFGNAFVKEPRTSWNSTRPVSRAPPWLRGRFPPTGPRRTNSSTASTRHASTAASSFSRRGQLRPLRLLQPEVWPVQAADRPQLPHPRGDIVLPDRTYVNDLFSLQRDVGIQIWRMSDFKFGDHDMAYDASFGIFNGEGMGAAANDSNRVGYRPASPSSRWATWTTSSPTSPARRIRRRPSAAGTATTTRTTTRRSTRTSGSPAPCRRGAWTPRWSGRAST